MKRMSLIAVVVLALCSFVFLAGVAVAEEKVSFIGKVKNIDLKSKTVVVTDKKTSTDITVTVEDKETLDKLSDGRINEGDEVKVKYVVRDGKNLSTYFKKTAGC